MDLIGSYVIVLAIIVIIGQVFQHSIVPIALILVVTGMLLSLLPHFPTITLNPEMVLDVFLPLLIYEICAFSSWRDVKTNFRPIALLSVGHVLFITFLVAIAIHFIVPKFGWALAILVGALVSPPDDVAIVSIAEKIRMPERILTILQGEGMFNNVAALTIFRLALAAIFLNEFTIRQGIVTFSAILVGETIYGLVLGYVIGRLREKISHPMLHLIASLLTPFFAYLPAVKLGGCGVLATAIVGFIIGNVFALRFTPEFRLISRAVWPGISFIIQNLIFLLIGLNLSAILILISPIPLNTLLLSSAVVILLTIIGRFVWVFFFNAYLPRLLIPSISKKDPQPPWQILFIIAWSGMRGGISLAASVAVPLLPLTIEGVNARALIIFLVFTVILATLILQGLSLPWFMKTLGIAKSGESEHYSEHLLELSTRIKMTQAVLRWLTQYKIEVRENPVLCNETNLYLKLYRMTLRRLKQKALAHDQASLMHDETIESTEENFLRMKIIEIERSTLLQLWSEEKIGLSMRNKLLERLDHQVRYLPS